jgi:hypothetical protein
MDSYVQYTLMREQMTDMTRRAELNRLLRGEPTRHMPIRIRERVWRLLRRNAQPAPTLVPHMKGP